MSCIRNPLDPGNILISDFSEVTAQCRHRNIFSLVYSYKSSCPEAQSGTRYALLSTRIALHQLLGQGTSYANEETLVKGRRAWSR